MEQPLVNILDQCIDRIAAGATVDDCLQDYPEHADELRDLLTIGRSLGELVTATEITSPAQSRLQQQLVDHIDNRRSHMPAMREKRKRRTFGMMSLGAAAVLALIMGVGIGVFATMSTFNPSALPPAVAEPTASNRELVIRHNPGLFTILRQGDTSIYFDVDIYYFGEPSEYLRIAAPTGLGIVGMEPISLQGWTLSTQDGLVYTFGDEVMRSSGIQIYSGKGNDRYGNVYIGHTESIWRLGDRLILRDANNDVLLDAAMHDILPTSISTAYDNTVMIYSEALYTDMFDPSILTHMPIYVDVINPGTDDEHIRIDNWLNVQDFDLSGWTLTSDTGIRYMLPNMEWYQPWGADRHIDIYTLPRTASIGKYHMDMSEPVWQSANTLTLTRPDGLSGTLVLHNEADSPQSPIVSTPVPNNGVQTIRPVYRYELDDPFLAQGCTVEPTGINLNLRLHPNSSAYVIQPLQPDDVLEIRQTSIEWDEYEAKQYLWLMVENAEGTLGWVRADMVEPVADCADRSIDALIYQQKEQLANWPSVCSIQTITNVYLREYADMAYQTTALVAENQIVDLLGARVDESGVGILWYQVRTRNNEVGWVRQDTVDVPPECSVGSPPILNPSVAATAEMDELLRRPAICTGQAVSGQRVYLREDDNTASDFITELPEGLRFDILQVFRHRDNSTLSWYEIRVNIVQGDSPAMTGWLLSSEVDELSACPE
ncbi:MAG: hypothetical protein H6670_03325 [Anaerolineaceae bacterium]|nr:hypothetical protein [Anaerolineaceae bacterium]